MRPDGRAWRVERHRCSPAAFHALEPPDEPGRLVWVAAPTDAAIVLGSTQDESLVDDERARASGLRVVRRHSGGGAVLVVPGDLCWVDLVIGRDDPLWSDDVGRASWWVGDLWRRALVRCGVETGDVHRGPLVETPWSRAVCFAGVGPGEVVGAGGGKVVGVAQRRTRRWARFQTAALVRWDPLALVDVLAPPLPADPHGLSDVGVATGVSADRLAESLVEELRGRSDGY